MVAKVAYQMDLVNFMPATQSKDSTEPPMKSTLAAFQALLVLFMVVKLSLLLG